MPKTPTVLDEARTAAVDAIRPDTYAVAIPIVSADAAMLHLLGSLHLKLKGDPHPIRREIEGLIRELQKTRPVG